MHPGESNQKSNTARIESATHVWDTINCFYLTVVQLIYIDSAQLNVTCFNKVL